MKPIARSIDDDWRLVGYAFARSVTVVPFEIAGFQAVEAALSVSRFTGQRTERGARQTASEP